MRLVDEATQDELSVRRVSRRSFLKLCAALTAALALPPAYAPRVAAAISAAPRLPVIWLRGLGCGGDTDAFLRAADPSIAELLFDLLSVEYHEALMVPSGATAAAAIGSTMVSAPNGYLAIVEGAIPTADDGIYLTVGGRPFHDVVREVCDGALATIAVGSCAFDGGLAGAAGGSTGAKGLGQVISGAKLVTLPGCPVNVENLTATIVHYLTFQELPPTDGRGRPLFAYGGLIHNECGRRAHFEFGEFVHAWGDEGAQKGWCLYKMGCKGPESFANCASVRYASGTSWPVRAGAACIACTMPGFWDAMSPFSRRLPSPIPTAPELSVDQVGVAAVAGVGALVLAHGAATIARGQVKGVRAGRSRRAADTSGQTSAEALEDGGAAGAHGSGDVAVAGTGIDDLEGLPVADAAEADAAEADGATDEEPALDDDGAQAADGVPVDELLAGERSVGGVD